MPRTALITSFVPQHDSEPKAAPRPKSARNSAILEANEDSLPVFHFGNPDICVYCGFPASHRDHVIAVSYQKSSRRAQWSHAGPWCWSCADCNARLQNNYFESFALRCEWVAAGLDARAKPILWHGWELSPLDYPLRCHILADIKKRRELRERADFYGSREYYLNLESLLWELGQMPRKTRGQKFLADYFFSTVQQITQIYQAKGGG